MRKDGTKLDISLTISPVRDANGIVVGASKVARDISGRKQTEQLTARAKQELERANERLKEVDRLKSEFLASMSHELRTPLNSIIGFTGVLRQQIPGPLNDEQLKQLNMVASSARHLLHLINEILDLSRIEAGRVELSPEWLNLHALTEDAISSQKPIAERKRLQLTNAVPDTFSIRTDKKILTQILLNLLSNAVKFTERGTVHVVAQRHGTQIHVSISDTGIGIKPEQLSNLFQAFRQLEGSSRRHYEGTGLGLHLSKRMLELLGGTISVESTFGQGTEFTFTVPIEPHESQT
jgi:signal transduction histidine kinase